MSNGDDTQNNCVLEVCCGGEPDKPKQARALLKQIMHHVPDVDRSMAKRIAVWLVEAYDFMPYGSTYAFKQEIARLAKTAAYQDDGEDG